MEHPVLEVASAQGITPPQLDQLMASLEAGKLLHFAHLPFELSLAEQNLLRPDLRAARARNISLSAERQLKGAAGSPAQRDALTHMLGRYRDQAEQLVHRLLPHYRSTLRAGNCSFRPARVEGRQQSLRANDRLLHVDAFPSRPNRGERILRVFSNINPMGEARVWRLGEPFEVLARRFLPQAHDYSPWQARMLHRLGITKSVRSEYDHLMLQLHDNMKSDPHYQQQGQRVSIDFAPGSTWVCFSDQIAHAAISGQYLLELTLHLPPESQGNPQASPLAILTRMKGHALI